MFTEVQAWTDAALSSAGPGRAVSDADAYEPAQLPKRAGSAGTVDGPLRVCFERCKEGSCAGVGARTGDRPLQGCHLLGLAIRPGPRPLRRIIRVVGQAFHGGLFLLGSAGQRCVCL